MTNWEINVGRWQIDLGWLFGLLACAGLGALYFITRTNVHTFDALSYTWSLESKPFIELFHPHHLLYGPAGWLAYRGAELFGYAGRANVPVQALNALAGGLGAFAFWRFGARWTGRSAASLAVALLIGVCYAYWVYAAEVEVYTLASAFLALTLWLMVILDERGTPGMAALVGLAHAGAIMFHQTNALFGFAVMTFLLLRPHLRRPQIIGAYLGVGVPAALLPYAAVAAMSRFPDFAAFMAWLTDYAASGQWGGFLSLTHFPALRAGLQTTVSPNGTLAAIFYGLTAVAFLVALWRARQAAPLRAWLAFAGVWFIIYLLFFWWWEPWNIEFWIALLPLCGLIMLAPLTTIEELPRGWAAAVVLLPLTLAGLLFAEHLTPILEAGDASQDHYRRMTDALIPALHPDDLAITRGNILDLYLPFYAGHPHVLSMRELDQRVGGDRGAVMGELLGQLDWATVTGRPFLIDAIILEEPRDVIWHPFGLLPEEMELIRQRYELAAVVLLDSQPAFYGSPRPDTRGRTAWRFDGSLDRWQAWGIDGPRFADDGWCFDGGFDPQLKGPRIDIEAGEWATAVLEITVVDAADEAQLFWHAPGDSYSLEQSVVVPLTPGRQLVTLPLTGAPGWTGMIERLRLDAVRGSDETGQPGPTACIHRLELQPSP